MAILDDAVRLSDEQRLVRNSMREICEEYDREYWREQAEKEAYPHDFVDTLAEHGWLGALIPEEYGGAALSTAEVVVMMEEIGANGGGFAGPQAIHGGVYNTVPIVEYASEEIKEDLLPWVAAGEASIQAFGSPSPTPGPTRRASRPAPNATATST